MKQNHSTQEQLVSLYSRFGDDLWNSPARLAAMLNDVCPGDENKPYIRAFTMLAELKIPQELIACGRSKMDALHYRRILDRFLKEYPIREEFAIIALDACANALGIVSDNPTQEEYLPKPFLENADFTDLEGIIISAKAEQTIFLKAGTYYVSKTLDIFNSITIIGAGTDETRIINIEGGPILRCYNLKKINLSNLSFYSVKPLKTAFVSIINSSLEMKSCSIIMEIDSDTEWEQYSLSQLQRLSFDNVPLLQMEHSRGIIEKCFIAGGSGAGIKLNKQSSFVIHQTTVEENKGDGIHIDSSRVTVSDCHISRNLGSGIRIDGNLPCEAVRNRCEENYTGIYVAGDAAPRLSANACSRNKHFGIVYSEESGGEAAENFCEENEGGGISVNGRAAPRLTSNACSHNKGCGIGYDEESGGEATENYCEENGGYGIIATGSAAARLVGNTCCRNAFCGIAFFSEKGGEAAENFCEENEEDGIFVNGRAAPRLTANTCSRNKQEGIKYSDSSGGEAVGNHCEENERNGILMIGDAAPRLTANTCSRNKSSGISQFFGGLTRVEVVGNHCEENEKHGIDVSMFHGQGLEGNTCSRNKLDF